MFYTDGNGRECLAEKGTRIVNGIPVTTWTRDITDANLLKVEAGTNGYKGGDTGSGSRTFLRIANQGGTDILFRINGRGLGLAGDDFTITLGGDAELATIKEALKWMISILEVQSNGER